MDTICHGRQQNLINDLDVLQSQERGWKRMNGQSEEKPIMDGNLFEQNYSLMCEGEKEINERKKNGQKDLNFNLSQSVYGWDGHFG